MKILLIGGTGVLSSAIVKESLKRGFDVTIVTRGIRTIPFESEVNHFRGDFKDREFINRSLSNLHFDAVIDFLSRTQNDMDYSIEVLHKVANQFLFISSACVYNTKIPGVKYEDSEKILDSWSYSREKWECECLLKRKSEELGFPYTVIRPTITYDDTRIPYGIMPPYGYHWTFCARILAGKPIIRWDKGIARWNMMRVEDFAIGAVGLIGNEKAYNEAYNICSDEAYSWNDVITCIENKLGVKAVIFDITSKQYASAFPYLSGEISGRSLDLETSNLKIKKDVPEFIIKHSLQSGINLTIDSYINNNYQKGIDWSFDFQCDKIIMDLNKKDSKGEKYKTDFCNYLGNAGRLQGLKHFLYMHKDNYMVRLLNKLR